MKTISHTQLCDGLKVSRARVDQWLSRGLLKLESETTSGRMRQWTKRDAIKLTALRDMADAGLPLERVWPHLQNLTFFRNEAAYLTIFYGPQRLIPLSKRGDPPAHEPDGRLVTVPGHLSSEILRGKDLLRFLVQGGVRVAIVVPLDLIEARVDRIFSEAE